MGAKDAVIRQVTEVSLWETVKKQYRFKLKVHVSVFGLIVVLMLVYDLFAVLGSPSYDLSQYDIRLGMYANEGYVIMVFYFIMMFVMGIKLTTKKTRKMSGEFPSNQLSNHLSNILFLATLGFCVSIPAFLTDYTLRFLIYFDVERVDTSLYMDELTYVGLITGILVTLFYMMAVAGVGYLIGELAQVSKVIMGIVIFIVYVIFSVNASWQMGDSSAASVLNFIVGETSVTLFMIKMCILLIVIFMLSLFLGKKREVSR